MEKKKFYDMNNQELFCVLAGDQGIMPQKLIKDILKQYLNEHKEYADLQTMVRTIIDETEE